MKLTKTKLREIIKEELLNEGKFYRLPTKFCKNNAYPLKNNLSSYIDSLLNGNDFHPDRWDDFIKQMKDIKKQAKQFSSEKEVPKEYKE